MNTLSLFPTDIYTFKNEIIPSQDLADYLDTVCPWQEGTMTYNYSLHEDKMFNEWTEWVQFCLNKVVDKNNYDCDRLDITNSWFNRMRPNSGDAMRGHRHSLSFYSAVYYFHDCAGTFFQDPVNHRTEAQIEVLRKDYMPLVTIPGEAGKLVIFPSYLFHSSLPNETNDWRYTASFNTMPAGKVNCNLSEDSKANIKIGSIND